MALVTVSLLAIVLLADTRSYAALFPALVGFGFGAGAVVAATNTAAMDAVPAAERGEASGVLSTARQVGGTLGLGAMGALVGEHGDAIATDALINGVAEGFGLAAGVCALGVIAAVLLIGRPAAAPARAPAVPAPPRRA